MRVTFDDPAAAPPVGPYSQVARIDLGTGTLLLVSGQIAVDAAGAPVGGDSMAEQTRRVFDALGAVLAAHGAGFSDVVNVRTFLTDMDRLREYGAVRLEYLKDPQPTSTTVEVSRLFRPEALLEVDLVAALPAAG